MFSTECSKNVHLTRTLLAETIKGVSHNFSFIIRPINLAKFSPQSSDAGSLFMLVTFSTQQALHALYLLCWFTSSRVAPLTPHPVREVLADSQVPIPVVGNKLVAQSLASVGPLHSANAKLTFLV